MTASKVEDKSAKKPNTPQTADQSDIVDEGPPRTPTPTDINIAHRCVLRNDVERLVKCFEDEEDQFKELVAEQLDERDEEGKSPLDRAVILDRFTVLQELISRGAQVNLATSKGYTSLHQASAWGRVSGLKALVDAGGDIQLKTAHGERPREVAVRYGQTECVDYLDWAEAKQMLTQTVTGLQETMADPEKIQGKLDRAEKNSTLALIKEKLEWIESSVEATTQDFLTQKQEFEEATAAVIEKINEPAPEKPEKK